MNIDPKIIKEQVLKIIKEKDDLYYYKLKKDKNFVFKGYANKHILYSNIKIKIRTRFYLDIKNNTYFYPVYNDFKIEKRYKIPFNERLKIAKRVLIDKVSYSTAGMINNDIKVSKASVMKYVLEFKNHFNYNVNLTEDVDNYDNVFICIDDTFRNLKTDHTTKKFRFRVVNIYQKQTNKTFINQIKLCIVYETNKAQDQQKHTANVIRNILKKHYKIELKPKNIYVCGDGAKYIKYISNNLNSSLVLDKFHCFQRVIQVFNYRSIDRTLSKETAKLLNQKKKNTYFEITNNLLKNDFENVYKILDNAKNLFNTQTKFVELKRLKNYIKNNEASIKIWSVFDKNVVMTETYIQQIIKSNFGNLGKIFSLKVFETIIKTKCIYFFAN